METLSWEEISRREMYHGHWLALANVHYDGATGQAVEGQVIDMDEDLAVLCGRVQCEDRRNCAIVFCQGDESSGFDTKAPPAVETSEQRCA